MSENQYPGGFIKKDPPTVTKTSAVGIWSLGEIAQYNKSGNWPTAKRPPDPPIIGTASLNPMGLSANISFTQPSSNGGLPIISYTANSSTGNLSNTIFQSGNGFINITGLAANTSYTFTVYDTTLIGKSITSANSNVIVSATIPDAPTIGTVTLDSTGLAVTIPFTAPVSNGRSPIISYVANSSVGGFSNTVNQSGSGSMTISGLAINTSYTFTMYDTNLVGRSVNSVQSNAILTASIPDAPTITKITLSGTTANISFNAPASNGRAAITSYTANSNVGNLKNTVNQSGSGSILVTGLTANKRYRFSVTANNFIGTSAKSELSANVVPIVFSAPYQAFNGTSVYWYKMVADNNGVLILVGRSYTGVKGRVSRSTDNGISWNGINAIDDNVATYMTNAIHRKSDNMVLATGFSQYQTIYTSRTLDAGVTWSSPSPISNPSGSSLGSQAVGIMPDDSFIILGLDYDPVLLPYYTTSTNGSSWSTPQPFIAGGVQPEWFTPTSIRSFNGKAVVIGEYHVNGEVGDYLQYTVYDPATGLWSALEPVAGYTSLVWKHALAMNSKGVCVLCMNDTGNTPKYFISPDGGVTWTGTYLMGGSVAPFQIASIIALDDDTFVAIGQDPTQAIPANYPYITYSADGYNWSVPTLMQSGHVGAMTQNKNKTIITFRDIYTTRAVIT